MESRKQSARTRMLCVSQPAIIARDAHRPMITAGDESLGHLGAPDARLNLLNR